MCRTQSVLLVTLFVGLAHSWDIAVTAGDRIEFYTDDGVKTDTVRFNSQNLTALAYDEVRNMLLYVDKQGENDTICGYSISFVEYKCYIERNGRNIQGLAFDPVTELLFFTDTKERSINWFSFKPGSKNNVYGNFLIKLDDGIPTYIAVDGCRGFIYWINANLTTSTIERARMNGSEREVVIKAEYQHDLYSLAIDQQAQKMYWKMSETSLDLNIYSADLNGKNRKAVIEQFYPPGNIVLFDYPNALIVSKQALLSVTRCSSCVPRRVLKYSKPLQTYNYNTLFRVHTESVVGIATNDKIKDQFQGISDCNHVLNIRNYDTNDTFKIAREYEGPFCVHGIKVSGQSLCKCTPGYTGERCDVSVCENTYCFQGNCSITEEGLPECRCNAGYSGERCELNACHQYCSNNGTCSLNEEDEPVCECVGEFEGERRDVAVGLSKGDCFRIEEKADKNKIASSNSRYYSAERNITLADLLTNWQKPVATISVVVEVKSNN